MIKSPIWKDIEYRSSADTLDYEIWDENNDVIHNGITMRMPDQSGITLNVNTRLEEYLKPDFKVDFTDSETDVIENPDGYREFSYRAPGVLETYGFLYDWSYEDNWTGQTHYNMTHPINGHIDERMKAMFTNYNTGETSFDWQIEYDVFVRFNPDSLFFIYSGESKSITVYTNGSWEITSMPDWLTASRLTGNEGSYSSISETIVTFTASANLRAEDRVGHIVFYADGQEFWLPVKQNSVHIFDVTPSSYSCLFTGGTCSFTVSANADWYVTGCPYWATISQTSGTGGTIVDLSVSHNPSYNRRTFTLKFKSKNKIIEVGVSQGGYEDLIEIIPSSYSFSYLGGYAGFKVNANNSWHIVSYPDWLTIETTGGTSGLTGFAASCEGNLEYQEYTGSIVLATDGSHSKSASVDVVLEAKPVPQISITPTSISYADTGDTKQFTIKSNTPWTLDSYPEWITVDKNGGLPGISVLSTTGSTNDTFNNITGVIRVKGEDNYATANVTLRRKKYTLSVTPTSIDAPISGGTYSITIDTNYNWHSDSPYTLSQSSGGSGTTVVTFSLGENTGLTTYKYIKIYNDDNYISVKVRQQGTQQEGPLTFYITEPGDIKIHKRYLDQSQYYVRYSLNAEPYVDIVKNENEATIPVVAGDIVQFGSQGSFYGWTTVAYFSGTTCEFYVEGDADYLSNGWYNYNSLFADCTGLTNASDMLVSNITGVTFDRMFDGCINLTDVPNIVNLDYNTFNYAFRNCRKLKETINFREGFIINSATGMYSGCTSLVKINASYLATNDTPTGATGCFESMFEGCTSLTESPDIHISGTLYNYSYNPSYVTGGTMYSCKKMFKDCTSLTNAPTITRTGRSYAYIKDSAGESMCESMFEGCTSLTTVQDYLPSVIVMPSAYKNMFKGCTSLTAAPKLTPQKCNVECFYGMFEGCTSLTAPPELETSILAEGCYENMFKGCTSLVESPRLPARFLEPRCYRNMFSGCTNLNKIECYAVDEGTDSLTNWVSGVANAGVFTYYEEKTDWSRGNNGIPSGWNAELTDNPEAYPLTFKFLTNGTLNWNQVILDSSNHGYAQNIKYKVNGGSWAVLSANTSVNVTAGDVIQLRSKIDTHTTTQNQFYGAITYRYSPNESIGSYHIFSSTARFVAEGNIMSIYAPIDYYYNSDMWSYISQGAVQSTAEYVKYYYQAVFPRLFYNCTNLVDVSRLAIPAKSITPWTYTEMFGSCPFEKAPILGFTNIFDAGNYPGCSYMFGNCSNLKYVKCLIEGDYTYNKWGINPLTEKVLPFSSWLSDVSDSGTFVKSVNSVWESGRSGIPSNWTVINV